ncbi:MAG: hypothetical protein JST75_03500 [Bacteroidetes bacterium]|nr:hypothetical protein [Bacteroidota bacterium]
MDTTSLAEQLLNKKYRNVKYMFYVLDNHHEVQFFNAKDRAGNPIIKMLLFTHQSQETIIYSLKQEEIFSLSK